METVSLFERGISGTLYSYYFLCARKAWLYAHNLSFEQENADVQMGKFLDNTTYTREKHQVMIDGSICIDYLKKNVVYEVKKSDKQEQMSIRQVQYYLYVLRKKGIVAEGQINYPLLKKTTAVTISEEDCKCIEADLVQIHAMVKEEKPPHWLDSKLCRKCAYYQLCAI